jgi:predicted GIY-YIG superfamily endonuclease
MKKYKLYYITSSNDTTPIYVGITGESLKRRKQKHTCKPYLHKSGKNASGKFHGQDIELHLVNTYEHKWVALEAEGALKLFLGIDWSERTKYDGGFAPKLTHQQVREIREKRNDGRTLRSLASEYNLNYKAIHKIVNLQSYKYVC